MTMREDLDVTARLAEFVVGAHWADVPQSVRHEAKRGLVNFVGAALGGSRDPAIALAMQALGPYFGPPRATVIGRAERVDALHAAFLNAGSANVLEFDDTHFPTVIHPAAPVAPALFALAEERPVAGSELLHAFLLGVETECRIGNAVTPSHYRRGWHITATCGVFGAAAAAGRLLGLDRPQMVAAFGLAATQSASLIESLGSMAKSVGVGNAAKNGLAAALLARAGCSGPAEPIAGTFGFARVMSEAADFAKITDGLGDSWEIEQTAYKPYPCGVVLFPVIDACLELRRRHSLAAVDIARVTVRGHPLLRLRTDRPEPASGRDAKVSAQHSVAVAFLDGAAGIAQYEDAAVAEPRVLELRQRVVVEEDPGIPVETALVTVATTDGRSLVCHLTEARGTPARPMSDAELEAKFRDLAHHGAPGIDAEALLAALWGLDGAADAAAAVRLAGG